MSPQGPARGVPHPHSPRGPAPCCSPETSPCSAWGSRGPSEATLLQHLHQTDVAEGPVSPAGSGAGEAPLCRTLVTGDLQPWHLALSRPLHLSLQCPPPRLSPQPSPRPCSPGAPGPLPAASEVGWWLDMGSGGGMAHGDPVSSQLPGLSPATSQHHRGLCVSPDPCCLGRQSRKQ